MLYVFDIRFYNRESGKEMFAAMPVPNTTKDSEVFMKWLYSNYPEYTHAEYVVDELVSGKLRVRIHDLKTKEDKTITVDEID